MRPSRWFDPERSFLHAVKRGPSHWERLWLSSLLFGFGLVAFGLWRFLDSKEPTTYGFFLVFGLLQLAQVRWGWLMSGGARYHGRVEMKEWESTRERLV